MANTSECDLYAILGVKSDATIDEIKSAYKKQALKYHPDKNNAEDAPHMFRKVRVAYETLSDTTKRTNYDTFGKMKECAHLKDLFLYYQLLVIEICQKYNLSDEEKREIIDLFNVDDLKDLELEVAHQRLYDKIIAYTPKFLVNRVFDYCPYIGYTALFVYALFSS